MVLVLVDRDVRGNLGANETGFKREEEGKEWKISRQIGKLY